jgi:DHA2 family methylenomycin A resistance protein-like MFS transporter
MTSFRSRVALAAICIGYFMTILDATVINVALTDMQRRLGVSIGDIQWVIIVYTLVFASLLLTTGTLGARYGNRKIYLIGLVSFVSASFLCGLAPTLPLLLGARLLQGIGAALMVPTSLGLISELFSDSSGRAKAIGIWGAVASIGAGSGPIVGGLLVGTLSWRAIFFINVPIGLAALIAGRWAIASRRNKTSKKHLDVPAQFMSMLGFGALTLVCMEGHSWGLFSPLTIGVTIVGLGAVGAFITIERSVKEPMLPLRFFRNKSFSTATVIGFLLNFSFYGQLFVVSLYFLQLRHLTPLMTGVALLPQLGIMVVASTLSGRVSGRFGPRWPMSIGLTLGATSLFGQLAFRADTSYVVLVLLLLTLGFGMAFTMPAMTVAVMSHAPTDQASTASGVLNAFRQLGGSFGVAILGGLTAHEGLLAGLHVGVTIAAFALLASAILSVSFVRRAQSS